MTEVPIAHMIEAVNDAIPFMPQGTAEARLHIEELRAAAELLAKVERGEYIPKPQPSTECNCCQLHHGWPWICPVHGSCDTDCDV